jgi:hypothetical protein
MSRNKPARILHASAVAAIKPRSSFGAGLAIAVLATLALAAGAPAQQPAADLRIAFDTSSPGAVAGMDLVLRYGAAGDPNAKPPMIRRLSIEAPAGMLLDGDALPRCTASDEQLRTLGSRACPAQTRIGEGTITAVTGFGPPIDPYVADAVLFNSPDGFIEVVEEPSSGHPFAFERIKVEGTTMSAKVARVPGGPPDGETTVREVSLHFAPSTGYVVTPPGCGAGRWDYSGTFGFDYGDVTATGSASCDPAARPARIALSVTPRRAEVGERTRFRFRVHTVDGAGRRPAGGATVRFAGRRLRTNGRGAAAAAVTLRRPGRHVARAVLPGALRARAVVRATR